MSAAEYRQRMGVVQAAPTRAAKGAPLERDILAAILELCQAHPRVAWAVRMNTGAAWLPGRDGKPQLVHFAFKGCADVIGQLIEGRFLAIECKRPGKNPTDEQRAFLATVNKHHGLAFVARDVESAARYLKDA